MEKFSPRIKYYFILRAHPPVLIFLPRIDLMAHHYNHSLVPPPSPSMALSLSLRYTCLETPNPDGALLFASFLSFKFSFSVGKNLSCCITSCGAATNCTRRSDKYHHKVIQCEFRDHIKTRHTVSPFLQHPCREASQAQKGCWI